MGYIQPKKDYKDGDVLYGIDLNASNEVIQAGVDDNFDRIKGLNDSKQDVINESNKLDYSLLDNTPDIPEKTSDLTNDSGFIDDSYHDDSKQDTLTSGINIKTINNESILGEGNLVVEGTGTTDYDELENQPSINNVTLEGNKSLSDLGIDIPTKISDLNNDNNTVTDANYVHTDSNYTVTEKSKLAGIEAGAQANVTEVVVDSTPTADTQLVIDEYDLDINIPDSEITDEYSDSPLLGYSSHYANNRFASKAGDTFTGNLIIANATYLKGIDESNNTISLIRAHITNNQGFVAIGDSLFPTRIWASEMPTINIGGTIYTIATTDDLNSYLPKSGGTLTDNLIVGETTDTSDKSVQVKNNACHIKLEVKTNGDSGIWNNTLSKYTLVERANGDLQLNGKLVIASDGISTFDNDIRLKKNNANAYIYIGDTANRKINEFQTENDSIKVGMGTDANGAFRLYDYTHSKDILRDTSAGVITFNGKANQATQDSDGNAINSTYLKKKNVAIGSTSITPSAANTATQKAVTWPEMDGVPTVVVTPNVGAGLDQNIICGYTGASKKGCTLWIKSNNTTARTVSYIAIYK